MPKPKAACGPRGIRARSILTSRYRSGMRRAPIMARPMAVMSTPETRIMSGTLRSRAEPTRAKEIPSRVKAAVKPATNSTAARSVTVRAWRSPSSETGSADTYDR